jgi:WD40 repeat protein
MKFARLSWCVLAASMAVVVVGGCGKKAEEEARVAPAPAQPPAGGPVPVPGHPGGVPANPNEKTRPPEPPVPKVTLADVLARDAEKWAAAADDREAARTKHVESKKKLAAAFRARGAMGEKVPLEVVGAISLGRKTDKGQTFGSLAGLSADGSRIAVSEASLSGGEANSWYRVVDLASGEEVTRFDAGPRFSGAGRFSPDGAVFAVGTFDKGMKLWDAKTGELRQQVPAAKATWSLAPDAGGNGWVASQAGSLVRLDGGSGAVVKTYGTASMNAANPVASPSGSILVAYSNSTTPGKAGKTCISLWDSATGASLGELELKASTAGSKLIFSPDSRTLYSHESNTIVAWDLAARTSRTLMEAKQLDAPALSPDGRLLAYYSDPELVLRDLDSGRERRLRSTGRFSPDSNPVFFPGGALLGTTSNSFFVVWDVALSRTAE